MPDRAYMVFTCDPGAELERVTDATHEHDPGEGLIADEWWQQHGPISARSEPAAIERLREMDPDLKANADVLYFAVAGFRPRKMIRQITVKHALGFADEESDPAPPAQGELSEAKV